MRPVRLLAVLAAALPVAAFAATPVPPGILTGDQTWSPAGSPYVLEGDVTVQAGVTLTIQAGATVQLGTGDTLGSGEDASAVELRVEGTLAVSGTDAAPVTFASSAASPAPNGWYGIVALPGGQVTLTSAEVHHAHRGLYVKGATAVTVTGGRIGESGDALYVESGSASATGLELAANEGYGAYVRGPGTATLTGLRVHDNGSYGVRFDGASGTLTGSEVRDSAGYGVYVSSNTSSSVTLEGDTLAYNGGYGVYAYEGTSGSLTVAVRSSIVAVNGSYGIYQSGGASMQLQGNVVWGHSTDRYGCNPGPGSQSENPLFVDGSGRDLRITSRSPARTHGVGGVDAGAHPFDGALTPVLAGHLYTDTTLDAAGSPYAVPGDLTIEPGVTLTVEPGVVLSFADTDLMGGGERTNGVELRVAGSLQAVGTAAAPISFEPASGSAGGWEGLYLLAGSGPSRVEQATISKARYGVVSRVGPGSEIVDSVVAEGSAGGVVIEAGELLLTGVTVRDNGGSGVRVQDASPTLTGCTLHDNGSYGVQISSSTSAHVTVSKSTLAYNGAYGLYAYEASSGSLTVTVVDDIVAMNGSYGIYQSGGASMQGSTNVVWGHPNDLYGTSLSAGLIVENPLFVDGAARDLRITSHSPARLHASDGADIGAHPYDGALTPRLTGHLYENTVLDAAGSPHVVTGDLTVEPGVTLTIQPTTVVRFETSDEMRGGDDTGRVELRVLGTLLADGTASAPIRLESNAAVPAPGDWAGVHLLSTSAGSFVDYATVTDAVDGVRSEAGVGNAVQRSTLSGCSHDGAWVKAGQLTLDQVAIHDNDGDGVRVDDASPTISRCRIYDNALGLYVSANTSQTVTLTGNTIAYNRGFGVQCYEGSSGTLRLNLTNDIVVENGSYGVYQSGGASVSSSHDLVWGQTTDWYGASPGAGALSENPLFADGPNRDLRITSNSPARLHGASGEDLGALAYDGVPTVGLQGHLYADASWGAGAHDLLGDVTVEPGITLTLAAGAEVRLPAHTDSMGAHEDRHRVELRVLGRLVASGTAAQPVRFHSGSASAAPGDWYGLVLLPGSQSALARVISEDAEYGLVSEAAATTTVEGGELRGNASYGLHVRAGDAVFDGILVHHNGGTGVYVQDASPDLYNLVVHHNGSYGVRVSANTSATVDMSHLTVDGNGGYGVYAYEGSSGTLRVNVTDSIVTSNGSYGFYQSGGASMTLTYDDVWGQTNPYYGCSAGTGSISANPLFVDPAVGNYHLTETSPVIDAGAVDLDHDAEGTLRPLDGDTSGMADSDLGAYEFNPASNRWPTADAGADRIVESGKSVTFDASGSFDTDGVLVQYDWDFGDGSTGSGQTVTHTFTGGTDRTVTLTVTDDGGASDTDTVFVEVNLAPTAEAGSETWEDPGIDVSFDASASTDPDGSIVAWLWDFGDGSTLSGRQVTHQYQTGGDYTVTLTVTDDDGATGTDTTVAHITGGGDTTAPAIVHVPVADGQAEGQAVTVSATVTDASGVGAVTLYHRVQGAGAWSQLAMTPTGGDVYSVDLPGDVVQTPAVEYWIEATDAATPVNTALEPTGAPTAVHAFTVIVPDTSGPSIAHTPISNGQAEGQAVPVVADVTDPGGVASVVLHYRATGASAFGAVTMTASGDTYAADIPAGSVTRAGVDYWIEATDEAGNVSTEPPNAPSAFHTFTVERTFALAPGELVVTEIMNNPSGSESTAEWFEVYNASGADLDLGGLTFADDGTDAFTVTGTLVLPAGGYAVLGRSADTAQNGGVDVDYVYSGFQLSNASDEIVVLAGTDVIDRVAYDDGATFPDIEGSAMALDPGALDAVENDAGSNWCLASSVLPGGDHGTPGAANDACTPPEDLDPPVLTLTPVQDGQPAATAVSVDVVATDASGLAAVDLYYRVAGTGTFVATAMADLGGDAWRGEIPSDAVTAAGVEYFVEAVDASPAANAATAPAGGASAPLSFTVTETDTSGPGLSHAPATGPVAEGTAIHVTATITDASGVAAARLHFGTPGAFSVTDLVETSAGIFEADIPASAVLAPSVAYWLDAEDTLGNASSLPVDGASAPFEVAVYREDLEAPVIEHPPVADDRPAGGDVTVSATVTDPSGVGEVRVYFRAAGEATFLSAELATTDGTHFTGHVPGALVAPPAVEYYLEAVDASDAQNVAHDPADAPATVHAFTVVSAGGDDVEGPVIDHTPPSRAPRGRAIALEAQVSDPSGVAGVTVYWRVAGTQTFSAIPMAEGDARWTAELPDTAMTEAGIEYYLEAVDGAPGANVSTDPAGAPTEVHTIAFQQTEAPSGGTETGCGCAASGGGAGSAGLGLGLLALALLGRRRRG